MDAARPLCAATHLLGAVARPDPQGSTLCLCPTPVPTVPTFPLIADFCRLIDDFSP